MSTEIDRLVLASLSTLDNLGPARMRWLLDGGSPTEAWSRLLANDPPGPAPRGLRSEVWNDWVGHARSTDLDRFGDHLADLGHSLITGADPVWPFADDPEPPMLLHSAGDLGLLGRGPAVAVVGTRRCTQVGRRFATELGEGLTAAGVIVVSGLAKGIDTAVHRGVLASGGRPVGVVATGLDVPYPGENRHLWEQVQRTGLMVTEAGSGVGPRRWRFPARNRIIASLASVTVVVESAIGGGAMHTVAAALERDRLVMAVPGSVTNPYARGTNQLLAEGATVAASVDDVLCAVGAPGPNELFARDPEPSRIPRPPAAGSATVGCPVSDLDPVDRTLLRWLGHETAAGPVSIDAAVARSGLSAHQVLSSLQRLDLAGAVTIESGHVVTLRDGTAPGQVRS